MKKADQCVWLKEMRRPAYMSKKHWERMLISFPHLTMQDRFAAEQLVRMMVRREKLEESAAMEGEGSPEAKALGETERLYFKLVRDLGGTPKGRQEKVTREDRSALEGSQFLRS